MAIPARSIIHRVVKTLNDETSVRWLIPDLVTYFNDGQRDIANLRPDSMSKRVMHALQAGYKQTLPADGTKLIDINANGVGSKGTVTLVSSAILDAQVRNWRSMAATNNICHYTYDPREPKTFEVYPPALDTAILEIEYSALPTDIPDLAGGSMLVNVSGDLCMGDQFANAIQNYILYRCYLKDTEYSANPAKAQSFYQAYANDLGVEIKTAVAVSPNQKTRASASEGA